MSSQPPVIRFSTDTRKMVTLFGGLALLGLAVMSSYWVLEHPLLLILGGLGLVLSAGLVIAVLVRGPQELRIEGETLIYQGHRYPLHLVEVGPIGYHQIGNASWLAFQIEGIDEQDQTRDLLISASGWPQFQDIHRALTDAVNRATRQPRTA